MKNILPFLLDTNALTCQDPNVMKVMKIFSIIFIILKILVPLILIITGIMELSKSVIADDSKELSKAISTLITKLIIGICIFFLPSILSTFIGYINGSDDVTNNYAKCTECIFDIKKCDNNTIRNNASSSGSIKIK